MILQIVSMAYPKDISIDDGTRISINSRVGTFLFEQRTLSKISLRNVARKLKIKRANIKKWEQAKGSPPCDVFFRIVSFYGEDALRSAMELDLEFQIEKYQRLIEARQSTGNEYPKRPAFIWAEHQYKKAVA
ncbi:MAG: helix-turn-helix transcriptional regulator [Bdellovibrionales bacterium]|nr:helix-turn-helix transcriptional regulator [Bdellovibrionales bacterium]